MKPSWDSAPKWARWLWQDQTGIWTFSEDPPPLATVFGWREVEPEPRPRKEKKA